MDSGRPSPLEPGFRIDRYELLYAVAKGGMGAVWVARLLGKHGFSKLFAVKTILPELAADSTFRTMFLDEARIASRISHPNVAEVLDLGEQQGILYSIMEWVEGDSLYRLGHEAKKIGQSIPHPILLRIVADTCAGLHAAHELSDDSGACLDLIHRDVSPQNILVTTSGVAKLIDFGVARARDRLAGDTSAGMLKGKVRYIAPEQARGEAIDRRADVWSIGAVLYAQLTGRPHYPGASEIQLLREVIADTPPLPLPASIPRPIARVVEGCLQPIRERRFATSAEVQTALELAMNEADLRCSQAQVAAYVVEITKKRIEARRSSLQLASATIEERSRVRGILDRQTMQSDGSTPSVDREILALSDPRQSQPSFSVETPRGEATPEVTVAATETSLPTTAVAGWSRARIITVAGLVTIAALALAAVVILPPKHATPKTLATDTPPPPASELAAAAVPALPPSGVEEPMMDLPAEQRAIPTASGSARPIGKPKPKPKSSGDDIGRSIDLRQ